MSSRRHNTYLDAARACILDVGWRRTTLTEVAARAGVSRMTIYRAWPDMQTLLADLMTREWGDVVAAVASDQEAPTAREIADGVVAVVRALRGNELFRRILDVDPELLLPYLLDRRGRSQDGILAVMTPRIEAAQGAGHVRPGDPTTLARTVLLAAHGLTLSAHTMTDEQVSEEELDEEFARLVAQGLRP